MFVLDALCDHVYQQPQPTAEPSRSPSHLAAPADSKDAAPHPLSPSSSSTSAPAQPSAPAPALLPPDYAGVSDPTAAAVPAAVPAASHGSVVDALAPLPSIHARRSVVVDSNGATFSVDDVAARRLRKEQRRLRAQQQAEADSARGGAAGAVVADEKPNAARGAAEAAWTDVPPEFCCALNGSVMKQPVRAAAATSARRVTCSPRSSPNTATRSTDRAC